jgi:hypothetical protein
MGFLLRRIPATVCCSMSLVPPPLAVRAEVEHLLARALEMQLEAVTCEDDASRVALHRKSQLLER